MGSGTCLKFYHPAVERSVIYGKMPRFNELSRALAPFQQPGRRALRASAAIVESGRKIKTL